ncbi:hypothetical protein [Thalassospira sp. HF15]|uniref:hypothetical protein n=1 Tax=Thalassospira sp. HF15 TaxID=2722755 RepID=UPI0014302EA2|nr:hypothetical protein [Thalassospira sp. HF15]
MNVWTKGYTARPKASIAFKTLFNLCANCIAPYQNLPTEPVANPERGHSRHFLRRGMTSSTILRLFHDKTHENFTCARKAMGVNPGLPKVARACGGPNLEPFRFSGGYT